MIVDRFTDLRFLLLRLFCFYLLFRTERIVINQFLFYILWLYCFHTFSIYSSPLIILQFHLHFSLLLLGFAIPFVLFVCFFFVIVIYKYFLSCAIIVRESRSQSIVIRFCFAFFSFHGFVLLDLVHLSFSGCPEQTEVWRKRDSIQNPAWNTSIIFFKVEHAYQIVYFDGLVNLNCLYMDHLIAPDLKVCKFRLQIVGTEILSGFSFHSLALWLALLGFVDKGWWPSRYLRDRRRSKRRPDYSLVQNRNLEEC